MTHREHLAQADRFIAECKNRIARQREIIATAYENGHSKDIPVSMLRALEEKPAFLREAPSPDPRSAKNADRLPISRRKPKGSCPPSCV